MAATFFCSVAGGMLAVLALVRMEPAAGRFVRLIGVVAFAAAVGVGVWSIMRGRMSAGGWPCVGGVLALATALAAAVVTVAAPIMARRMALLRMAAGVGGVCGMAAACVWSTGSSPVSGAPYAGWELNLIGQVLGSLLIGGVTVAWLLGHAYLTATKLTIAPLRRVTRLFALAVGLRSGYLLVCLALVSFAGCAEGSSQGLTTKIMGLWLVLSLRVGVGLLPVGAFAYMVSDCVKRRSTQSATGILYFASVFVYVGELSSQHLLSELGLPL